MAYDAVIVGGGLVGLAAALALGERRFRTLVVFDRMPSRQEGDDGRAYALSVGSCNLLTHLGLDPVLASHAQPMYEIVTSSQFWPSFYFTFSRERDLCGDYDHGGIFGKLVESHALANAILAATEQCPFVDFHVGPVPAVGVTSLMVIAEGKNGVLARAKGAPFVRKSYQTALTGTLEHTMDHEGLAHEHFLPSGVFALLPMTGRRSSFVWTGPDDVMRALVDGERSFLYEQLRARVGDCLGDFTLFQDRVWSYPLQLNVAMKLVGEGFCIIGDSAHAIHPLAGQGLNLGLRDVAALVDVLVQARDLGLDCTSQVVLERYEAWRWTDIATLVFATDIVNSVFTSERIWLRPIQTVGLAVFDWLGPLKRSVTKLASGQQGDLPSLLRP